jgi:hypothetical protein
VVYRRLRRWRFTNGTTSQSVLYSCWAILAVLTCGSSPPLLATCTNHFIYLFLRCPFLPFPGKIQLGLHNLLRYQKIFASNSLYYCFHAFRHVSSQQTQLSNCKRQKILHSRIKLKLILSQIVTKLIQLKENDAVKNNSQETGTCRNPSTYNFKGDKIWTVPKENNI